MFTSGRDMLYSTFWSSPTEEKPSVVETTEDTKETDQLWLEKYYSLFTIANLNTLLKTKLDNFIKLYGDAAPTGATLWSWTPLSALDKLGALPTDLVPQLRSVTSTSQPFAKDSLFYVNEAIDQIGRSIGHRATYAFSIITALEHLIELYKNYSRRTISVYIEEAISKFFEIDLTKKPIGSNEFDSEFARKKILILDFLKHESTSSSTESLQRSQEEQAATWQVLHVVEEPAPQLVVPNAASDDVVDAAPVLSALRR